MAKNVGTKMLVVFFIFLAIALFMFLVGVGIVYLLRLKNRKREQLEEKIEDINFIKKDNDIEEIPIVVLEPNEEGNNSNNIDNSGFMEYDINKYFSNIKVGYFNINNNK